MTDADPTKAPAAETDALSHAWAWFVLHSGQRMQGINYFLLSIAFVVAGYGAAYAGSNFAVALAIGLVGIGITFTFWMLDRRTRQLIKASEIPLSYIEEQLAKRSGIESIRILDAVENPAKWHLTYTKSLAVLKILVFVLMVVAVGVAAWALGAKH